MSAVAEYQRRYAQSSMDLPGRVYADDVIGTGLAPSPTPAPAGEGARWRLNPLAPYPTWMLHLLGGVDVLAPAAGYPQLCEVWEPVDWASALAGSRNGLRVRPAEPNILSWSDASAAVAAARESGYTAAIDTAVWVTGRHQFAIEAWGVIVHDEHVDDATRARVTLALRGQLGVATYAGVTVWG